MYSEILLNYAYGQPNCRGIYKAQPSDFIVDELLGFELTGEGEHLFLRVEKIGLTTEEVIQLLARALSVPVKSISYAGLKDKFALTRQWLCVHMLNKATPSLDSLSGPGWCVLEAKRHIKKLKIGYLTGNHFTITLRDISDMAALLDKLALIKHNGVPNYFGEQRFGHMGRNLEKAEALLFNGVRVKNHFLRGMYLSAARSYLFNQVLSFRVADDTWHKAIAGDLMMLSGTHSIFSVELPDAVIEERVASYDLSPTAPLWGEGELSITGRAKDATNAALVDLIPWCRALEGMRMSMDYRPLGLNIEQLQWHQEDNSLTLTFSLQAGCYATAFIRELITTN